MWPELWDWPSLEGKLEREVGGEGEVWETLGDGISRQGRWERVEDHGPYMGPQRQYLVGQRVQGHIN